MTGPDQRAEFKGHEDIEAKSDGDAISVTGMGRGPETNELSFETFAPAAYDDGNVQWTTYINGNGLNVELETTATGFSWGFEVEGGRVRYTRDFAGDTWHDMGAFSPDGGETWLRALEVILKRFK